TQTRAYEQKYLEERGFEVRAKQKSYTINENLLGVTMSGGEIDKWEAPGEGARGWCAPRSAWPADPLRVTLKFVKGEAVELDGKPLEGAKILARLNTMFAQYGVGRGMYTGDTVIGLKGRIVFEAPGLTALLAAHRALEEAVLSKQQNRFKPEVARKWVELVYEGFYHDPLKTDLEAFLASSQEQVNGEVVLETRGGRVDAVAIRSPHILNAKGATYAQSADWGVEEAEGFIKLFGMSSTLWAEVNRGRERSGRPQPGTPRRHGGPAGAGGAVRRLPRVLRAAEGPGARQRVLAPAPGAGRIAPAAGGGRAGHGAWLHPALSAVHLGGHRADRAAQRPVRRARRARPGRRPGAAAQGRR